LYLPTAWFHFIVSLNTNYQCNARSGVSLEHRRIIQDCGFDVPPVSAGFIATLESQYLLGY
jgi:hypothetical protein